MIIITNDGITGFLLIIVGFIIIIRRPDLLRIGFLSALTLASIGLIANPLYYSPSEFTITNLVNGILLGFGMGFVSSTIYNILLNKEVEKISYTNLLPFNLILGFIALIIYIVLILTKVDSFSASVLSLLFFGSAMFIKRQDLVKRSIYSGIFVLLIIFLISLFFVPNHSSGLNNSLLQTRILTINLETLIFFSLHGAINGVLLDFLTNSKSPNLQA